MIPRGAYMDHGGTPVSRSQFEANLAAKAESRDFQGDVAPLLRPGVDWDFTRALEVVRQELVARLPGEPWRGEGG